MASGWTVPAVVNVVIPLLVVAAWLGYLRFSAKRDARRALQERFATDIEPEGPFTECRVRFPMEEMSTPAIVRATQAGWYMGSPEDALAKPRSRVSLLTGRVLIPWHLLAIRGARFPMRNWLRFDVPSAQVTFFVRRSVALPLLREAGRPLPD